MMDLMLNIQLGEAVFGGGRDLFILGEPRVNVVTLNLALDERQ